jgi:LAGLIDADG endonuclease
MNITTEYIAGFIDGEGYFGLVRKSHKDCLEGYYYTPVLKVSQVTDNDEVLNKICDFIGYGNYHKTKNNGKKRGATSLEFRGMTRVIPIAKKLFPHLIVKKKQAELIIQLEKTNVRITNENRFSINEIRENIYNKLKILNKRGLAETKRKDTER